MSLCCFCVVFLGMGFNMLIVLPLIMDTIVLAGGYASRMSPTTDEVPKLLLPVAGRPVLTHVLDSLGDMPEVNVISVIKGEIQ